MALPSFTSLGINDNPLLDTWTVSEAYLDPRQTDFDGGNKRLRRQPGDEVARYNFDILFENAEYAIFLAFMAPAGPSGGGISRFTMRVWNGSAMISRTVQFASKYKPIAQPPKFMQVTFDLWIYPS